MTDNTRQSLRIENHLAALAEAERWLASLMEEWAVPAKAAFAVDLVVNEAVTNVISYAFSDSAAHWIDITLNDTADAVVVEVADDGRPFDPLAAATPALGTDLEHASIGGRGILLIKAYSEAQHYSFISGRNHLKLVVRKQR